MKNDRQTKNAASEGTVDALVRARIAAEEAQKALKAADRDWAAAAEQLSGADWRKAVDKVKDRIVRIQAACIVWWDHFGSRPASDPWNDMDDYKAAWRADQNADKRKVQAALVTIGYPEHKAAERMKSADEYSANGAGESPAPQGRVVLDPLVGPRCAGQQDGGSPAPLDTTRSVVSNAALTGAEGVPCSGLVGREVDNGRA